MKKFLFILVLLSSVPVRAQLGTPYVVSNITVIPCVVGNIGYQTATSVGLYVCTSSNVWTPVSSGGGSLPSGFIGLVASGTCPTGTTQDATLNGKTLFGTTAANGDVGTTGGSDAITPTVNSLSAAAQVFSGTSANTNLVTAGTPAGTNGTSTVVPLGTINTPVISLGTLAVTAHTSVATKQGTAAGNVITTGTHTITGAPTSSALTLTGSSSTVGAQVFTGSQLGTHQHTLTATGTNGTSAVTGTLNAFDNRSAYTKVIFCKVN